MRSISAAVYALVCCLVAAATTLCIAEGASAAPLLFVPHSGKFPYHFTGSGGETLFEGVRGTMITSERSDYLLLVLSHTLFDLHVEYLKFRSPFGGACKNEGKTEAVLLNMIGHFGFADPGAGSAVLLLVPSGFEYECSGEKVNWRGAYIGSIAAPSLNTATELMRIVFKQSKGIQEFTTFLLGNETLIGQFKEESLNGSVFEQVAQAGEAHLLALPGQGTFLLVSP